MYAVSKSQAKWSIDQQLKCMLLDMASYLLVGFQTEILLVYNNLKHNMLTTMQAVILEPLHLKKGISYSRHFLDQARILIIL